MSHITNTMYRARLGVGASREVKKSPSYRLIPGVGVVQINCCHIPRKVTKYSFYDGGNPVESRSLIIDGGISFMSDMLVLNGGKP
jgi:hypothetical protein